MFKKIQRQVCANKIDAFFFNIALLHLFPNKPFVGYIVHNLTINTRLNSQNC